MPNKTKQTKRRAVKRAKTPADTGAASAIVTLSRGMLTVQHGDTGEILIKRRVTIGFWSERLWPLLKFA